MSTGLFTKMDTIISAAFDKKIPTHEMFPYWICRYWSEIFILFIKTHHNVQKLIS